MLIDLFPGCKGLNLHLLLTSPFIVGVRVATYCPYAAMDAPLLNTV